ncbi:MAG: hypothetical protein ACRD5M_14775 [Candidatus Acidiferrales bacterium]
MFKLSKYERILVSIFVLTLPLANPWVRGDGVGYYAYARALIIERHLSFEKDWQHGNESFTMGRLDEHGRVLANQYTRTGHIANLWSIGASLLWTPFLVITHWGVLLCDRLGARIPADGFSTPYLVTLALASLVYGFLGLWISFRLARKHFDERWAFLGTVGIWWASSLPVYMYFNPSYSHADSAFAVALFLWYWDRTRNARTIAQWLLLGLISGLTVNVYYPNGVLLLIPLTEAMVCYWQTWKSPVRDGAAITRLFLAHVMFVAVFAVALLPTLITRRIIFGDPLQTGYMAASTWNWRTPQFWNVLFSADHGLLSWTPILTLSLIGIALLFRVDRPFSAYLMIGLLAFYAVISFYPDWDGLSSFGNRFFVSLTAAFILGLTSIFDRLAHVWQERRAAIFAYGATTTLIIWNLGLIFQWGTHLIPARGPISWREASYNQVAVVPTRAARTLKAYMTRRKQLMGHIEEEDVKQLKSGQAEGTE